MGVQRSSYDWAKLSKNGFLVGLGMFLVGMVGGILGPAIFGSLPDWEVTLFFDMEVLGIVLGIISVLGFGILMPLME